MDKIKAKEIIDILSEIYPHYESFLNYHNNYELLVAVILSAQTTDIRVNEVTPNLFKRYPNPYLLADANFSDVLTIIKSLGLAYNKANNIINMAKDLVTKYDGKVPNNKIDLMSLSGVGPKTANVVLALGFNIPTIPVDTHVKRLAIRLGFAKKTDSLAIIEEKLMKYIAKESWINAHHLLILYGRNVCKAINPKCEECKLKEYCKVKN